MICNLLVPQRWEDEPTVQHHQTPLQMKITNTRTDSNSKQRKFYSPRVKKWTGRVGSLFELTVFTWLRRIQKIQLTFDRDYSFRASEIKMDRSSGRTIFHQTQLGWIYPATDVSVLRRLFVDVVIIIKCDGDASRPFGFIFVSSVRSCSRWCAAVPGNIDSPFKWIALLAGRKRRHACK